MKLFTASTLSLGSSVWLSWRLQGDKFWFLHCLAVSLVLAVLLWHVLLLRSTLLIILIWLSAGLWVTTTAYRLLIILYQGRRVTIQAITPYSDSTIIEICSKHAFRPLPGAYFYVYFPGFYWRHNIWTSYPMLAMWDGLLEEARHKRTTRFSFVIGHEARLSDHLRKLESHRYLLLEGPYGGNINLNKFETVFLVAKGSGIVGVLPLAISLAERRRHDDDLRKASQNFPTMEGQFLQMEENWKWREKELENDEQELITKEQNLLKSRVGKLVN